MPHLQTLVERHKDDPFVLLGINYNDAPDDYRKGAEEFNISWPVAYQPKGKAYISQLYNVLGFPTYVLVGPDGKILAKRMGNTVSELDAIIQEQVDSLSGEGY